MCRAFLGIDVSKGYADFSLLDTHLQPLCDSIQFDDTRKGHDSFHKWLVKHIATHKITQIRGAVESTGGLENNWLSGFDSMVFEGDVRITRVNPLAVKNAFRAELATVTTDGESARHIAVYVARYEDRIDFSGQGNPYDGYKSMITQIRHITRQTTATKNFLRHMLYQVFPEIQAFCPKTLPNWLFAVLEKYPTPRKLARIKPENLSKIKGITLTKAEELIAAAKSSVGVLDGEAAQRIIQEQSKVIKSLEVAKTELKKLLETQVEGPEIELLTSMTGIGRYSAGVIMIHIGDISRFATPKKMAKYFGITPVIRNSGDKKGKSTISKRGASMMRETLYMCAKTAVMHDPHLGQLYQRLRSNGKKYNDALVVIMHKMLRMIWGILTHKTPYDASIDQRNQACIMPIKDQEEFEIKNKRREQAFDPMAPISNRARKKRKEHLLSQAIKNGQVRDLEDALLVKET